MKILNRVKLNKPAPDTHGHTATNQEGGDYLHNQDYYITPAQAATLTASGLSVTNGVTLINVDVDPEAH
jgi:hypothetical protein